MYEDHPDRKIIGLRDELFACLEREREALQALYDRESKRRRAGGLAKARAQDAALTAAIRQTETVAMSLLMSEPDTPEGALARAWGAVCSPVFEEADQESVLEPPTPFPRDHLDVLRSLIADLTRTTRGKMPPSREPRDREQAAT